jgi:hypothetical protein
LNASFRSVAGWISAVAAIALFGWATRSIFAAEVLDQQCLFDSAIADSASSSQEVGQTFTVGVTGTMSRIEVLLAQASFSSADGVFNVYSTSAGLPDTSLGSATISSSLVSTTVPTFISFDLSSFNIPVRVGDVLAFGVSSPGGGLYFLPDSFQSDPYAAGTSVQRTLTVPPGPWSTVAHDDSFKTYVNVTSAPLLGDYNGDGIIDAADYTVWRDTLAGGGTPLLNDPTPGVVDQSDYTYWVNHFGATGSGEGARVSSAVPEPGSGGLALLGIAVLAAATGAVIPPIDSACENGKAPVLVLTNTGTAAEARVPNNHLDHVEDSNSELGPDTSFREIRRMAVTAPQ